MNWKLKKFFDKAPIIWVPMWGISKLRRRAGRFAGEIPGDAQWYDQWYARAMSRENISALAERGVNLVILPFSLGGSLEAEKEERDDFERVTAYLHEYGMMSLPYLQYQNVLQEENIPEDIVWAERLDGSPQRYSYWRRTACQSSAGFISYMKGLINDALKRGADGIWIDNTYLHPCRCELCHDMFKDYLDKNCRAILDFTYLRDFNSIEIPIDLSFVSDPIVRAFTEFNMQRNLDIQIELKKYMEQIKTDAVYASNPALYRGRCYGEIGVDFVRLMKLNDMMYYENKLYPEEKQGQRSGNFRGFIAGTELGVSCIPGTWKKEDFDATTGKSISGLPDAAGVEKIMLEPVTFGGVSGAFWSVRAMPEHLCECAEDQKKMYYEFPAINDAMRKTSTYIHSLPVFGDRINLATTAVLHHRESMLFQHNCHASALHGVEELLAGACIPYNTLFSEELAKKINSFRLLIVSEVPVCSDYELKLIATFVEQGGRLLVIGQRCGRYDEALQLRLDSAFKEMTGVSIFDHPTQPVRREYGKGEVLLFPVSGKYGEAYINMMSAQSGTMLLPDYLETSNILLEAVNNILPEQDVKLVSSEKIACSWSMIEGRKILQLLGYSDDEGAIDVSVTVASENTNATLYRFGQTPIELNGEIQGERITFEPFSFHRHAALVFPV
ncbi:MAG: hypothetical protein JXR78_05745 [Victivallales bacterium]|nr:hypothetical protein [Victivallales bacterium]